MTAEALKAAIVEARMRRAQRLVEDAQHTLEKAAQELSVINGGAALYKQLGALADRCHKLWYKVPVPPYKSLARYGLDHEPSEYDRRDFPELFADLPAERVLVEIPIPREDVKRGES